MLLPPIINAQASPAEGARARTLLRRALGLLMVLYWLPIAAWALGKIGDGLLTDIHPTLERPGFLGYPDLFIKRLAALDLVSWFIHRGYALIVLALGASLVMRGHKGPKWGEVDE